ncbi:MULTISPECIES: DUF3563 family protein [unclassified Rhizobacter]|uniref:DUF3563 family protein n=1 Tax=unclassified Rhizobacter TaxID=2640088 RepID=UPI0006F9D19E|nr:MULTISPECIES: DUF3563 family protein [unclassified Rhizobacter]KQU73661.1 hypothetical protein ASC88_28010 [Rhizobacter sp. Root29]KQW08927.1 hypothetical protein ASC98_24545 [Rhizobacter sp. Root1238]KRB21603.1 hypothetical protein ASE08_21775 [Rhizobacter sp. Root16D2]
MQTLLRFACLALSLVFRRSSRRARDDRYLSEAADLADFEQRAKRLDQFTTLDACTRLSFLKQRH